MNVRFIVAAACSVLPGLCFSQSLTGIWKGYFITTDRSQYKVEVQMKEDTGTISGVTYSYLNTIYYGKASMTGSLDTKLSKVTMQETKTVEVRASQGSVNCLMNYSLLYSKSGAEEFLEGTFTSKYETAGSGILKGEDCGGGVVYLRRVATSDFYLEPFLQTAPSVKKVYDNQPPPAKKQVEPAKKSTPAADSSKTKIKLPSDSLVSSKVPALVSNVKPAVTDSITTKHLTDSVQVKATVTPSSVSNNRQNELMQEFEFPTKEILLTLYDNGEIDGDTVSVYLNNQVLLSKQLLSSIPLQAKVPLSDDSSYQEITFVAENLGRIPPNTALLIIQAGTQTYRLHVLSNDKKNAVLRFRYRPTQ